MALQLLAVHALRIWVLLRFEQRRAEPMPRRKGQRFGFVVYDRVVPLHRPLERSDSIIQFAVRSIYLTFKNPVQHTKQIMCAVPTKYSLRSLPGFMQPL